MPSRLAALLMAKESSNLPPHAGRFGARPTGTFQPLQGQEELLITPRLLLGVERKGEREQERRQTGK